jgi:hypothetical protein
LGGSPNSKACAGEAAQKGRISSFPTQGVGAQKARRAVFCWIPSISELGYDLTRLRRFGSGERLPHFPTQKSGRKRRGSAALHWEIQRRLLRFSSGGVRLLFLTGAFLLL